MKLDVLVRTLRGGEVDDVAVALEHVHLLDGLDGLNIDLLEGGLELLVIASRAGRRSLDLSAGGTLATISFRKKKVHCQKSKASHFVCICTLLIAFRWARGGRFFVWETIEGARAKEWRGNSVLARFFVRVVCESD